MRAQYRSRGRPDYGGGGGGGSSSSRYSGPSGYYRGRGGGRGHRYMRRPSYDHHPASSSSSHGHHRSSQQQHYMQHEHHHHHHHHREEVPAPVPSGGQCSHRIASPQPLLPELEYHQRPRREATATELKPESPTPSDKHRKRKRRHRSPASPVLSNISSGSSFYIEEEDSDDANASPDYDEVTSGEESGEEEVEEEEEIEEILVVKHKKRKKDKKKKDRERRQRKKEKKRKKEILEERICPPEHDVAQKEIFSSGKNILVSVSFDDEGVAAGGDADAAYKAYRKSKKKKSSRKRSKSGAKVKDDRRMEEEFDEEYPSTSQKRKRKLDDIKPVAIIDLERSPGKQLISSPKEVIVLSDEEVAGGSGKKKNKSGADQVGPNTPPEPAPKSPESYDPFDPTKSPMGSLVSGVNLGSISTVSYPEHHQYQHHHHHRQRIPKDIASPDLNFADDGILDLHPSSPMDQLTPRAPYRHSPQKPHRTTPAKKPTMPQTSIGWDDTLDDGDISPYSPRSSDCDDHMFDPPTDANGGAGSSATQPKTIALTVDNLRKVFGNDKNTLYGDLRRPNEAVQLVDEMYKPQKVTMEMLDDIPNSAVDLQIKEKLIQKLQRQDRIIEEVKIFLKPHFNKKRINKEEYKNIMKKSVPKICHSRSGEINPLKIQNLILAYVKKAMAKRKLAGSSSGNAIVSSTTAVT